MKKQPISSLLICCLTAIALGLFLGGQAGGAKEAEWFGFVLSDKLAPDSPANIGKLLLDAPAGKHGFVQAKDGHFYFEDGTAAKFWGTNLCFSACFPAKKQAEITARRLAFFGFNAVRLHHMDFYFEPRGIFEDICPAFKHPQAKQTGSLSKRQLEKLDYLIYQLKQQGIYININLLVSRHFTEADGVKHAAELGMAAKPVSMFDPKLIELQKQYAQDLLTHYNPYTRLRYCDDPAVALIEITNENSVFSLDKKSIPDYYRKQIAGASYLEIEKAYFREMTQFLRKDCQVKAPITGSQYSDNLTQQSCDFIDTHAYWDHPRFPNQAWDNSDFAIHNKSMFQDENLGIIGAINRKAVIASPVIPAKAGIRQMPFTISEWNHCYPNQYAYETPALIASEAARNNWDGLFQFAYSHGWKFKPNYKDIRSYFDTIANPQQLILSSLGSLIFHSPPSEASIQNNILRIDTPQIKGIAGLIKGQAFELTPLSISPEQDGAVFLYAADNKPIQTSEKLILLTISEVKNRNSGWNEKGRFNWGRAPAMLKKINVEISLTTSKSYTVYELNTQGTKAKQIPARSEGSVLTFSTEGSNSPWFALFLQ